MTGDAYKLRRHGDIRSLIETKSVMDPEVCSTESRVRFHLTFLLRRYNTPVSTSQRTYLLMAVPAQTYSTLTLANLHLGENLLSSVNYSLDDWD